MAILKTYDRQVQTSAQSGAGRAIDTGASQMWGAVGGAVQTVAGVVGEVKRRNDNISTIRGRAEYDLGIQTMNENISRKVQELSTADNDYTPEQLLAETQEIRDAFANDFNTRISPTIKNPEILAGMRGSIDAANGKYGAEALGASYLKHRTAYNVSALEIAMMKKVNGGDFDGARKTLDEAKEDIGLTVYNEKLANFKMAKATHIYTTEREQARGVTDMYLDGEIEKDVAIALLEKQKEGVDSLDVSSGHKGNINDTIGSSLARIDRQSAIIQKSNEDNLLSRARAGDPVDNIELQTLLDSDKISEDGAKRVSIASWKTNQGYATTENNAAFGKVTSDVNNGKITSFNDLEKQYASMTYDQYQQAETSLANRLTIPYGAARTRSLIAKVSSSNASITTLADAHKKIDGLELPLESKEALRVLTSNAFRLNKNPELSPAYNNAVADIMELERYLDLSVGGIAHRLTVMDSMTIAELEERKTKLKSVYDGQVGEKIKENIRGFTFKKKGETILVINPDGEEGEIPISQWGEAEKAGYKRK